MTYQTDCTLPAEFLEQLSQQGLEGLPEMIRVVINEAMRLERQKYLAASPYERTPERQGHANGYKPKTVLTRTGDITFDIPQVRDGGFYPEALEKGLRSERALLLSLAEMYVQGVSTRKVAAITEELIGREVSSSQVSRATALLDEVLVAWRERPLDECCYLYLGVGRWPTLEFGKAELPDARYEKVRQDGQVRDAAILLACGVGLDGKRRILGLSVALSEAEVHWRQFLESLTRRGLRGVQLVISDDHAGLRAARQAVFGGTPWQRCQFHLQQNAGQYVSRQSQRKELAADLRMVFTDPDRPTAENYLKQLVTKYSQAETRLADWLETSIPEGLTIFNFPAAHRQRLRTSNLLERLSQELKRRTRVVRIFPNRESCERLATAILMEKSEEWGTGRIYLNFDSE